MTIRAELIRHILLELPGSPAHSEKGLRVCGARMLQGRLTFRGRIAHATSL